MSENTDAYLKNHAYVFGMAMRAYCLIEGMKAENADRASKGLAMAYTEDAFIAVANECGLHHNAIITNMGIGIY